MAFTLRDQHWPEWAIGWTGWRAVILISAGPFSSHLVGYKKHPNGPVWGPNLEDPGGALSVRNMGRK